MKIAIGVGDDDASSDAMALGAALGRSFDDVDNILVHIYDNNHDFVARAGVEFDWEEHSREQASKIVANAAQEMASRQDITDVSTGISGHRASGHGLAEFAHDHDCRWIVIGSAPGGSRDRFMIGSTANQLLHGAATPIILTPGGYRRREVDQIGRIVVTVATGREGKRTIRRAAKIARGSKAPLHLITILLHSNRMIGPLAKKDQEELIETAKQQISEQQAEALADLDLGSLEISSEVVEGDTVADALGQVSWEGDDLLIVPSSRGVLHRVFLGDMNYKIVRSSQVATLVLPRFTD